MVEFAATLAVLTMLVVVAVFWLRARRPDPRSLRAASELQMLSAALAAYDAETGKYPEDWSEAAVTSVLSPKKHWDPESPEYERASFFLYQELTGDKDGDGIADPYQYVYLKQFERSKLVMMDAAGTKVRGFKDPWGNFYGYSTAALAENRKFQNTLRTNPGAAPPGDGAMPGFNVSAFDLWSTAGTRSSPPPVSPAERAKAQAKWIRNW